MEVPFPFPIVVGFLALIFFYTLLWKGERTKGTNSRQPPQPAGALPVIGHLHQLGGGKPLFRVLGAMADKLGPVFMLRLGVNRVFVISTWEAAKECFTTNDQALAGRPKYSGSKYLGYEYAALAFSPYGPYWREVRKIATTELLSTRQLELLRHVRTAEVNMCMKELYSVWAQNGNRPVKVDMKQQLKNMSFNIIVMMIAGKRYFGKNTGVDEVEARRFQKAISELFHLGGMFLVSDCLPFLKWFDFGGYKNAMKNTANEMYSIVTSWLEEHRRMRLSGNVEGREDFIHVILSTLEDAKFSEHDQEHVFKTLPLTLIVAGTDSTSAAMAWGVTLLLNHPDVLKKAQHELDTHVGKDRNVDESDIKNLVYLQAIIKETMRLYPAAPIAVPHQAIESCYINGYYVPAGTWLISNIWKVQRDPRKWPDPDQYKPERFLTAAQADVDFKGQHFELMPFGTGRRSCPGMSLATQVLQLTLARLIHGFDMVTPLGEPVDMEEGFGLSLPKVGPLEVILTPRLPSKLYE